MITKKQKAKIICSRRKKDKYQSPYREKEIFETYLYSDPQWNIMLTYKIPPDRKIHPQLNEQLFDFFFSYNRIIDK